MNTITVAELIEKLSHIKNKKMGVYMLTERSDDNYNEDGRAIIVHPIEHVYQETNYIDDGWINGKEECAILEIPEP